MASIPVFMMLIGLPMLGFISVAMQIFLSLRTNKWYGRVLPALDGLAIIGLSVYLVFTMEKTAILNILLLCYGNLNACNDFALCDLLYLQNDCKRSGEEKCTDDECGNEENAIEGFIMENP